MNSLTDALTYGDHFAWTQTSNNTLFTSSEYGKEFDDQAKGRMIFGASLLNPFLQEFRQHIAGRSLEVGPFKNPLLHPDKFHAEELTYIDADDNVVDYLNTMFSAHEHVKAINLNLNQIETVPHGLQASNYTAIVISQVLNYLDLYKTIRLITELARHDAHLFINNVVDYGIPELFSPKRPKDDVEIIQALSQFGWRTVKHQSIPPHFAEQKNPRTIIVARREA